MPLINCVILNYNDAKRTAGLVAQIRSYSCFQKIVIVDNASTDGSCSELMPLVTDKVRLIQAAKNGGYGSGNNLGVRYSVEQTGATHVVIANPDTVFTEDCIVRMSRIFERHERIAVVGAVEEGKKTAAGEHAWPLRSFTGELFSMGPISRRLLGRALNYPASYFCGRTAVPVDIVHGSMLMVDAGAFLSFGGYDEEMFLYQEEAVLGLKAKQAGYRTFTALTAVYRHEHAASIGKEYGQLEKRQKLRHESTMLYFRKYLKINRVQEFLVRIWFVGILAELWIWSVIRARI